MIGGLVREERVERSEERVEKYPHHSNADTSFCSPHARVDETDETNETDKTNETDETDETDKADAN